MSVTEQLATLRALPLFEGVPDSTLRIAAQTRRRLHFQPQEVLLTQGSAGESLLLLTSGVVRISSSNAVGHERVLGYIYAPAVLGETAVLTGTPRTATVTAVGEVSVQQLFADELQLLGERSPRILWNLAALLARRITEQNGELLAASISTQATLALVLLGAYTQRSASKLPQPERLSFSPIEMSLRLGISRETVMRLLRRFVAQKLLRLEGNYLTLLDIEALEAIAHDLEAVADSEEAPDTRPAT